MATEDTASEFLWLASYPDGALLNPRPGAPHTGQSSSHREPRRSTRIRAKVPPTGWLRERLCKHGGSKFDTSVLACLGGASRDKLISRSDLTGAGAPVLALLKVGTAGAVCDHGVMTLWSQEAEVQRGYYGWPDDCYTLRVEQVWHCIDEELLHHRKHRHAEYDRVARLQARNPLCVGHWGKGSAGLIRLTDQVVDVRGRIHANERDNSADEDRHLGEGQTTAASASLHFARTVLRSLGKLV